MSWWGNAQSTSTSPTYGRSWAMTRGRLDASRPSAASATSWPRKPEPFCAPPPPPSPPLAGECATTSVAGPDAAPAAALPLVWRLHLRHGHCGLLGLRRAGQARGSRKVPVARGRGARLLSGGPGLEQSRRAGELGEASGRGAWLDARVGGREPERPRSLRA